MHDKLGIKVHLSTWFKRMCEYGFEENIDFSILKSGNPNGGIAKIDDYIITIDMAKELCMIQRSDIGREFRKYFIECEKQLKEVVQKPQTQLPTDYLSALKALVASEEEKQRLTKKIEETNLKLNTQTMCYKQKD